ncbi:hypothetical protein BH09ACT10_BH09ACT10_19470 [soil metagenome]
MPSPRLVEAELADLLVAVVDCDRSKIKLEAELVRDLGVDSLSMVEIGDALGARFNLYIPDSRIDAMVTVQDAVDAVVEAEPARAPSRLSTATVSARKKRAVVLLGWFIVVGVVIGLGLGLLGTATFRALGLKDVDHPTENVKASAKPSASATTDAPTEPTAPAVDPVPQSTIRASPESISPGQRITFTGVLTGAANGATATVQRKDGDSGWVDFPVDTRLKEDGKFSVYVQTSKSGNSKWRLKVKGTDFKTPTVTVQIG